ncbi:hypothetical protein O7634_06185 [Micromonospora sp. WMMD1120]|uniref:hypothetical protein n=1 Tax=Micromonospora sp. WMMD1120 TaxID=3016106 RepID=UPI0024174FC7|nr:hypothetical protein [Micromonospora sp. WMMD1120]MDG4806341.1 hypothetical protein [Micromonospora sp. WMMD1120]
MTHQQPVRRASAVAEPTAGDDEAAPRATTTPDQAPAGPDRIPAGPDQASAGPDRVSAGPDRVSAGPDQASAGPDRGTLRLALVVGGLVLAVLLGFGLGRMNTTGAASGSPSLAAEHTDPPGVGPHNHGSAVGADPGGAIEPGGLAVSAAGFTLAPLTNEFAANRPGQLRFQVRDAQRRSVTRFAIVHDKPMHLIVVRRDLTGYQHLHPTMAADGTWSVPLTLARPGVWRAYADFTVVADDGTQTAVTLGTDLVVPGDYQPVALPAPATSTTVGGFTVAYQGTPQAGTTVPLTFRVDGPAGAAPLERYLGAYGHLVALREGDLGYLHVHPEPELVDGQIKFWLTVPGPGRYRLYLDFQVDQKVQTANFTQTIP